MKKILLSLIVLASTSVFAAPTRGYLYMNQKGRTYFDGLTDKAEQGIYFDVNYALNSGMINQDQLNLMLECQNKKTTHAILVTEAATTSVQTPSGIPVHITELKTECVSAPGFLEVWREFVNK